MEIKTKSNIHITNSRTFNIKEEFCFSTRLEHKPVSDFIYETSNRKMLSALALAQVVNGQAQVGMI